MYFRRRFTFIILLLLIYCPIAIAYLQLSIKRFPSQSASQIQQWNNKKACTKITQQQYSQICYHKDISYSINFIHRQDLYYMSIDFTTPISWIKGPNCIIQQIKLNEQKQVKKKAIKKLGSRCSKLEQKGIQEQEQQIQYSQNQQKKQNKTQLKNKKQKSNKNGKQLKQNKNSLLKNQKKDQFPLFNPKQVATQKIQIGSLDLISGSLQKARNISFHTKDQSKLKQISKLIMIGLFMTTQDTRVILHNTNFLSAQQISHHTNQLSDGAISLRFDDQSQNSFLNQIFQFTKSNKKIVTITLGDNATITLGDLSVKNSQQGYSGIQWLRLSKKKYPQVTSITLQDSSLQFLHEIQLNIEAIFTISASYLSFPEAILNKFLINLNKVGKCQLGLNNFIECKFNKKSKYQNLILEFEFQQIRIWFQLKSLFLSSISNKQILNIRKSESDYIILGQPVFLKYFLALDYQKNRIGISVRKLSLSQKLAVGIVGITRILILVAALGCCLFYCFSPIKKIIKTFYKRNSQNSGNSNRYKENINKLKYTSIEYKGKIKNSQQKQNQIHQIFGQDEVQGI